MRKILNVTVNVLMILTLLCGCGSKVTKEEKPSADSITTPTQNSNMQDEKNKFEYISDSASSATIDRLEKIEKINVEGNYIAKPVNVVEDNWLVNLAGGSKKTIKVRIGELVGNEPYIELEGKDSKITLVANGSYYEYHDGTQYIKRRTINFLTGKRFDGEKVVKDYSGGKHKIVLIVDYNDKGIGTPVVLFYSKNESEDHPQSNFYKLELSA